MELSCTVFIHMAPMTNCLSSPWVCVYVFDGLYISACADQAGQTVEKNPLSSSSSLFVLSTMNEYSLIRDQALKLDHTLDKA